MAKKTSKASEKASIKRDRGTVIYYDGIPDEVYGLIVDTQAAMAKQLKRAVSQSQAITKLLKAQVLTKQINT